MSERERACFILIHLFALVSCSARSESAPTGPSTTEPALHRSTVNASNASELAQQIGARFLRRVSTSANGRDEVRQESFFWRPWNATFRAEADGAWVAIPMDEPSVQEPLGTRRPSSSRKRLEGRFSSSADGELKVSSEKSGVWIKERIANASGSVQAQVSQGRLVYAGAKSGLDRVYEVSDQRIEEYLRLSDLAALEQLTYEVETGPAIAELKVDRSGDGLVAIDAEGIPLLKAPQPRGVDAAGHPVEGKLIVSLTDEHHYSVRVVLTTEATPTYPILLDPSWVSTGAMSFARSEHTATVLPDGRVLVVGGYNGNALDQTEMFDPVSNTWSTAAKTLNRRNGHTSTLLSDGSVLVTGGNWGGTLSSAERYNPANNTWSHVPAMSTSRESHTASLLSDGNVLVAAGLGIGGNGSLSSAELYNPTTNTWSAASPLNHARYHFTATVLPDGRVFVAGGFTGSALSSVEIYDSQNDTWTVKSSMGVARYYHSAALTEAGKVLIVGGVNNSFLSDASLYDPLNNSWAWAGVTIERAYFPMTALQTGKVLAVGGFGYSGTLATATLFDPVPKHWTPTTTLVTARSGHSASLLNDGDVLVTGGVGSATNYLSSAERLTPPLPHGAACIDASQCESGYCVDAVCCNTACGGGICGACSVGAGAAVNGTCKLFEGDPCDDGNPCTLTATCHGGICFGSNWKECTPTDQCHVAGVCDPATGDCSSPVGPNGTACDSDPCNKNGICASGVCVDAQPVDCDDDNHCTEDTCGPNGWCVHSAINDGEACDDSNACTENEVCQSGNCVGPFVQCTDGNSCTIDSCQPLTGCVHSDRNDGAACDDNNACTEVDRCLAGACIPGESIACVPQECQVGGSCNTIDGQCVFGNKTDGTPCSDGVCDNGSCVSAAGASGAAGSGGMGGSATTAGYGGTGAISGADGSVQPSLSSERSLEGGGCSCRVADSSKENHAPGIALLAALGLGVARRRRWSRSVEAEPNTADPAELAN